MWLGSEQTRLARRRMSRRSQLVRERTGLKNQIHAVLHRNLVERPPASDLFGVKGLRWLDGVDLPDDERETVSSCLRQLQFLGEELDRLDRVIARAALGDRSIQLLLTVPGVNLTTASAFMAAVGDIGRFESPSQLVSYLGLDPKVHQSGIAPARHCSISKQGCAGARWALVESAWVVARAPGPLHAFAERIRARRGANVATVAVARKLVVLFWHMLTKRRGVRLRPPFADRREEPQSRAAESSSLPEHPAPGESATVDGSTAQPSSASENNRWPSTPSGPNAISSPSATPSPEPLDLHP